MTQGVIALPLMKAQARIANQYVKRVQATARTDRFVAQRLARVVGLIDAPSRLLRPEVATRVAAAGLKHRRPASV